MQPASRAPLTETATRLIEAVEAELRLEPPLPDSTLQACLWLPLPPPPRRPQELLLPALGMVTVRDTSPKVFCS